ncbi:RIP metalloprotease RseP [candidate division KSB1 bacterium]|nr:RIP metalloprotease RseP [candidate division KSB1 bacterium]
MNAVMNILINYIVPFVFVLGLLVFIHEFGHFLLAKLVGIRVERFSLGFPPRLFGKKIGDTDYCISAVPFGGYVKMSGMIDESMDKVGIKGEPWEFMSKPMWMRFLVIFAGPAFNVLLTIFIFSASVFYTGIAEPVGPVVGKLVEGMPAESIGLQEGDVIVRIDSQPINTWDDILNYIHKSAGKQIELEWERNGLKHSRIVVPKLDEVQNVGMIGIEAEYTIRKVGIPASLAEGSRYTWRMTKLMGKAISSWFDGRASFKDSIAGPIKIAKMAGDTAKTGMGNLLIFAAFLSLNLGLLNLLPIPVLDGGHLLLLSVEGVMRKPLSVKLKMTIQQVGLALLLAFMLYVIINDFSSLGN